MDEDSAYNPMPAAKAALREPRGNEGPGEDTAAPSAGYAAEVIEAVRKDDAEVGPGRLQTLIAERSRELEASRASRMKRT